MQKLETAWKLGAELGRGAFGVVFRAVDAAGRPAAVKFPLGELSESERARIGREAELLAGLRHPALVDFYGAFEGPRGRLALVYEYAPGKPLSEALSGRPLPPSRALPLLGRMASGVQALHDRGLIHRDLKTENFLIDTQGELRLIDYGLLRPLASGATLTQEGMVLGTPVTMAPELFRGERATIQSDLYALGIVAFELLSGAPPFLGDLGQVMAGHLKAPVPKLSGRIPAVPAKLQGVLEQALAKDPAARPKSARAFFQAFEAALRAGPDPSSLPQATQIQTPSPSIDATQISAETARPAESGLKSGATQRLEPPRPPPSTPEPPSARPVASRRFLVPLGLGLLVLGFLLSSPTPALAPGTLELRSRGIWIHSGPDPLEVRLDGVPTKQIPKTRRFYPLEPGSASVLWTSSPLRLREKLLPAKTNHPLELPKEPAPTQLSFTVSQGVFGLRVNPGHPIPDHLRVVYFPREDVQASQTKGPTEPDIRLSPEEGDPRFFPLRRSDRTRIRARSRSRPGSSLFLPLFRPPEFRAFAAEGPAEGSKDPGRLTLILTTRNPKDHPSLRSLSSPCFHEFQRDRLLRNRGILRAGPIPFEGDLLLWDSHGQIHRAGRNPLSWRGLYDLEKIYRNHDERPAPFYRFFPDSTQALLAVDLKPVQWKLAPLSKWNPLPEGLAGCAKLPTYTHPPGGPLETILSEEERILQNDTPERVVSPSRTGENVSYFEGTRTQVSVDEKNGDFVLAVEGAPLRIFRANYLEGRRFDPALFAPFSVSGVWVAGYSQRLSIESRRVIPLKEGGTFAEKIPPVWVLAGMDPAQPKDELAFRWVLPEGTQSAPVALGKGMVLAQRGELRFLPLAGDKVERRIEDSRPLAKLSDPSYPSHSGKPLPSARLFVRGQRLHVLQLPERNAEAGHWVRGATKAMVPLSWEVFEISGTPAAPTLERTHRFRLDLAEDHLTEPTDDGIWQGRSFGNGRYAFLFCFLDHPQLVALDLDELSVLATHETSFLHAFSTPSVAPYSFLPQACAHPPGVGYDLYFPDQKGNLFEWHLPLARGEPKPGPFEAARDP